MSKIFVRHTVADFAKWKSIYDQHETTRKQYGCKSSEVFTDYQKPNEVLIVFDWESKEKAEKFLKDSDLKQVMEQAGVISAPEVSFAE